MVMSLLMMSGFALTSCDDTEDGSYVPPITQYEKIAGTWVLNSITQVDEIDGKEMTLTDQFDFDSFGITLSTDDNGQPSTFSVRGNAPALLPESGTWTLENPFVSSDGTPARIHLNDKTVLTVTAVPGAQKVLEFKFTRTSKGQAFVSYKYNLIPVIE